MAERKWTINNRKRTRRTVNIDEGSVVETITRLREKSRCMAKDPVSTRTAFQQGGKHERMVGTG